MEDINLETQVTLQNEFIGAYTNLRPNVSSGQAAEVFNEIPRPMAVQLINDSKVYSDKLDASIHPVWNTFDDIDRLMSAKPQREM